VDVFWIFLASITLYVAYSLKPKNEAVSKK
jgi:hypothetical protein